MYLLILRDMSPLLEGNHQPAKLAKSLCHAQAKSQNEREFLSLQIILNLPHHNFVNNLIQRTGGLKTW